MLYAMLAVLVERGVITMFWALDKRREWRAKMRAEVREEMRVERDRQYMAWFERLSQEKGIPLEELLPGEEDLEESLHPDGKWSH